MAGIDSTKFYGDKSKKSRVLRNISNRTHDFNAKAVCPTFKARLEGPSRVWKVFRRQKEAIAFAKDYQDVGVFSFEIRVPGKGGQRMYQVAHSEHMWLVHRNRPLPERCTYEVIQEDVPCKLYMDLEYSIPLNPDKDGNKMVEIFIQCTRLCMKEVYDMDFDASQVLWLDSSTETKFSCHLIFQFPDCAFKDNREAGKFVEFICAQIIKDENQILKDELEKTQDTKQEFWSKARHFLTVKNSKGHDSLFCDLGVYSRNRNFRMYLSTKFGKDVPLIVSSYNKYCPQNCQPETPEWEKQIFLDSLITNIPHNERLRLLTFDKNSSNFKPGFLQALKHVTSTHEVCEDDFIQGQESSPYPEVDEFVREQISRDDKPGYIRHWRYFTQTEVLQYSIGNFRYCRNIGRHHKSNNIMIIVSLRERQFYQKCFDPECRGFRSIAFPLPLHATPAYFFIEEESFSDMCISEESPVDDSWWADDAWEDQNFVSQVIYLLDEVDRTGDKTDNA